MAMLLAGTDSSRSGPRHDLGVDSRAADPWTYVVTDVELDGPWPGINSMRSFASVAVTADGELVTEGRLPHTWPGLWTPNSSASLLAGVGRPLPVCDGYDPQEAFTGDLQRLVVASDGGAALLALSHQVETAFRAQ